MTNTKELINFNEAFSYGWEVLKKNWWFILQIWLISFFVMLPFTIIDAVWNEYSYFTTYWEVILYILFYVCTTIFSLVLSYNLAKINLDILHGKPVHLLQLFTKPTMNLVRYFVTSIMVAFMFLIGLVAFIVPGIYFLLKYGFAPTLVIDKNLGILKAGEASARITNGEKWQLFAFTLVLTICMLGILLAGLLLLIVGIIPAIFMTSVISSFAFLHVYKKLLAKY